MKRLLIVLGPLLAAAAASGAWAQPAPPAGCTLGSQTPLLPQGQGDATINCTGVSETVARQLADVLTRVLQNRLDPQAVMAKLNEIAAVPEQGVARALSDDQRQRIINSLLHKPTGQIAINAHPLVEDSAEYAQSLATTLATVGWQIENNQIRRRAPKELDTVAGVALVVRDRNAPPPKARQLKEAFDAANLGASLVSDAAMPGESMLLWIGRRPEFEPPK